MENQKQKNPGFLHRKYRDLNSSPEVGVAAKATTRGRISSTLSAEESAEIINPAERNIQSYLDWIHGRINPVDAEGRPDQQRRENNLKQLKASLHRRYVIQPENIPESYWNSIKRKHQEEGHGDIEIPENDRRALAENVINDQKYSLDNWIDYLTSNDAKYPDWLKYFAMRNVLRMGRYDKQKKTFMERTGGAVAPFPDLNREVLAIVFEAFERQAVGQQPKFGYDIADDTKQEFLKFLQQKNFAKLYALAIEEFKPISEDLLKITDGEWRTYPRGSDPKALVESIAPYGTGWCIRGESMAERYLVRDKNELQVFYSLDKAGKPTVPRVVMVVNAQGQLMEVRGVAPQENLDPYISPIVEAKLKEFLDGERYKKKSADMKQLTLIANRVKAGINLTRDELVFLYEIDAPIEGFGYQTDPRIAELQQARDQKTDVRILYGYDLDNPGKSALEFIYDVGAQRTPSVFRRLSVEFRKTRNPKIDMPIVFDCMPEQIAHTPAEVNEQTKAYVGQLTPGIFEQLRSITHIYTTFPEKKIRKIELELPGMTGAEWIAELERLNIEMSNLARNMLLSPGFLHQSIKRKMIDELLGQHDDSLPEKESADLIHLTVADLGFSSPATTKDIYAKAEELGFELCPAEVGPALRRHYFDQPLDEHLYISMKQITDFGNYMFVFALVCADELWLGHELDHEWNPDDKFIFRLRPSTL